MRMMTISHGMTTGYAASLFCSGGIADLALRAAGYEIVVSSELLDERAQIYKANFPGADVVVGDIRDRKSEIIKRTNARLRGGELDLLLATPPCQGMSRNGRGKLLSAVRQGLRPEYDPRNQLIIDTVDIIRALRPRTVVMENVPEMQTTLIEDGSGEPVGIPEYLRREMPSGYCGTQAVVEFADYGVPQRRQRLITIYTRDPVFGEGIESGRVSAFPSPSHSRQGVLPARPWNTVDATIGHLPPLDAGSRDKATSGIPFHRVPLLDEEKYFWVSNTPPGKGAFDNQCVNPACRSQSNPTHGSSHDHAGINRAHKDTPIRCVACGELLPRPWVRSGQDYRLMSGYTSAYKRMRGDLPASALTRNLSYACSDRKIHPRQNRVLSLKEAFLLHTIEDFPWLWERADGRKVSDKLIREVVGESVPPRGLLPFFQHIARNETGATVAAPAQRAIA